MLGPVAITYDGAIYCLDCARTQIVDCVCRFDVDRDACECGEVHDGEPLTLSDVVEWLERHGSGGPVPTGYEYDAELFPLSGDSREGKPREGKLYYDACDHCRHAIPSAIPLPRLGAEYLDDWWIVSRHDDYMIIVW